MSYILGSVKVVDPLSKFHGEEVDILISDGIIKKISKKITHERVERLALPEGEKMISPGWFDFSVHFNDPGHEYKEGIDNGLNVLARSGFTAAGLLPNTQPVIQRKTDISYVKSKSQTALVDLFPYGAITMDCKGEELTEMIDMHHAGATAFTDGTCAIENADILLKTLLYLQKFGGTLIQKPEDHRLNLFGSMNEGKVSTMLGLKGMPDIAESLMVQRDLKILEYAKGKIHFSGISTEASVEMIQRAKEKGLNVTCDVSIHQLLFDEEDVSDYDTNCKVNPPLRTKADKKALIEGVKHDVIDVITSHHLPQDEENKKMEFDLAAFGMIGVQSFFPGLIQLSKEIPLDKLLACCTTNPRKILNLPAVTIEEGIKANLTVFECEETWEYTALNNLSRSSNSPFLNKQLEGKVWGTIHGEKKIINQ